MPLGRRLSRLTAAFAALSVLALAGLPAEHTHPASAWHDGDHARLIHRHYQSHQASQQSGTASSFDHADDDHGVEWLSPTVAIRRHVQYSTPQAALAADERPHVAPQLGAGSPVPRIERSVHDPPWRAVPDLRGPPFFAA